MGAHPDLLGAVVKQFSPFTGVETSAPAQMRDTSFVGTQMAGLMAAQGTRPGAATVRGVLSVDGVDVAGGTAGTLWGGAAIFSCVAINGTQYANLEQLYACVDWCIAHDTSILLNGFVTLAGYDHRPAVRGLCMCEAWGGRSVMHACACMRACGSISVVSVCCIVTAGRHSRAPLACLTLI